MICIYTYMYTRAHTPIDLNLPFTDDDSETEVQRH